MTAPHAMLVGTLPTFKAAGLWPPGHDGATYDWRARPRSGANSRGVLAYPVMPLSEALRHPFRTHAMLLNYVLFDAAGAPLVRQPRVSQDSVPWLESEGLTVRHGAMFLDVDTPGHVPWTADLLGEYTARIDACSWSRTALLYFSPKGVRVVQEFDRYVPNARYPDLLQAWRNAWGKASGLRADSLGWNQPMAPPRYTKADGTKVDFRPDAPTLPPLYRDHPGVPMAPDDLPQPRRYAAGGRTLREPRTLADGARAAALEFDEVLPPAWVPRARTLADALLPIPVGWRAAFLALAGALLDRGVPPSVLPELLRAVSHATGNDDATEDRVQCARTTARRRAQGLGNTGYDALLVAWPTLAAAVDEVTATGAVGRARAQLAAAERPADAPLPSGAEIGAALAAAIEGAPPGVSLIVATVGAGKTTATKAVAAKRARAAVLAIAAALATRERREVERRVRRMVRARRGPPWTLPPPLLGRIARVVDQMPATTPRAPPAPPGSRTAISAPTNRLAEQIAAGLRADGLPTRRLFSPLAVRRADKTPECRFHATAVHLVRGGQSVRREFCEGRGKEACPYRGVCAAVDGEDGPPGALVTVGNHGLLGELDAAAGATGTLVIDEPPPLLVAERFTAGDFAAAEEFAFVFERTYVRAMRPLLLAAAAHLRDAPAEVRYLASAAAAETPPLPPLVQFADVVRRNAAAMPATALEEAREAVGLEPNAEGDDAVDIVECARRAVLGDPAAPIARPPGAPTGDDAPAPLEFYTVERMRNNDGSQDGFAACVGRAGRVYRAVRRAALSPAPTAVRVDGGDDAARTLVLTCVRADYAAALRRGGPCVLLDATADVPLVSRAAGVDLEAAGRVLRLDAADGAPMERTFLYWASGSRKHLFARDGLVLETLVPAVKAAVRWALERDDAKLLGLVTLKRVALAIEAALYPDSPAPLRAWMAAELPARTLLEAVAALAPVLAEWTATGRAILLGHYGALRGLDYMAGCDALVTLGDPWPNLAEARDGSLYLGMGDWERRYAALVAAELAQADGRIRAIWRKVLGRCLRLGAIVPASPLWSASRVQFRRLPMGRPKGDAAMTTDELRLWLTAEGLSVRAAARELGCSHSSAQAYLRGTTPIPPAIAAAIRLARGRDGVEGEVPYSDRNDLKRNSPSTAGQDRPISDPWADGWDDYQPVWGEPPWD